MVSRILLRGAKPWPVTYCSYVNNACLYHLSSKTQEKAE